MEVTKPLPMRKGQAPQAFIDGKLEGKDFRSRSPEERKRIARLGVEAREKKKKEKKKLQEYMKDLLELEVSNEEKKKFLKQYGFKGEEATNSALLMTILFKKGCTGDVGAVKEIIGMMDRLDVLSDMKNKKQEQSVININIQPVKSKTDIEINEEDIMYVEDEELDDW